MNLLDLSRRVKSKFLKSVKKLIAKISINKRRLYAVLLLGKAVNIMIIWSLLPVLGLSVDQTNSVTALAKDINPDQVVSVPTLILEPNSIDPIRLTQEKFKISKVESRAEEKRRLARTSSFKAIAVQIPEPSLEEKRALAQRAAEKYGIDWKILEAVWQVESGKKWSTSVASYAGAKGPMQFMSGTWHRYAVDGNGDGVKDIANAEDAVFAGANYLAANGAAENIDRALFAYNHAGWYVTKVKKVADSI